MVVGLLVFVVLAIVVLAVLAGVIVLVVSLTRTRRPAGRAPLASAPAAVVAFRRTFSPFGGARHYARVFFVTAQRQQVTTEVYLPGPRTLEVGQQIWVDYSIDDPTHAEIRDRPAR